MSTQEEVKSIVEFPAADDPLAHQASKNDELYFFMLPLEIRLMIYEYVVAVAKPILPEQVTKRANKFFPSQSILFPAIAYRNSNDPLDVISLARVCRRIYHELEKFPVFYRVNTFCFECFEDLHVFLSAITPKRREMIRYITLFIYSQSQSKLNIFRPNFPEWAFIPHHRPSGHTKTFLMSLLTQCKDLKELRLILNHRVSAAHMMALSRVPIDRPSAWNLPYIRVRTGILPEDFMFGDAYNIPSLVIRHVHNTGVADQERLRAMKQFNMKMFERRNLVNPTEDEFPSWYVRLGSKDLVEEAIGAANIDFPGELRKSQNRFDHTIGPVSSRTRRKNTTLNPSTGALTRELPKYGADGVAVQWNYTVIGVRRDDYLGMECNLEYWTPTKDLGTSWETVDKVVTTPSGHTNLSRFYLSILRKFKYKVPRDPKANLQELDSMPSPDDVFKTLGGLKRVVNVAYKDKAPSSHNKCLNNWAKVMEKWKSTVEKLEKEVAAEAEREAKKEAKKEVKKQKDMEKQGIPKQK
ncbi:uncharacterized protein GGS22DRAFT_189152 [Annulohypoxylon maeteangense]|uniref:uncharacterized protein n=1 Tax=Annulohypoxylon maeteangense TaxID=1927788 RepID=UPI00200867CD|nr:uncharacterized protein GGS22DRAFT_189152 [Annulohypoxylon maeteangense]KAI0884937.1 hypothetical protein GGS22DRAFT_189152 [Annulohypoxylon maeteangense]